jgi:TonB family protein
MTDWRNIVAAVAAILVMTPPAAFAREHSYPADPRPAGAAATLIENPADFDPGEIFPKISAEKSGTIPTKNGRSLRMNLDLGNVRVVTDGHAGVSYRAIVEADSRDPGAEEFLRQFNVTARQTAWGVVLDAKVPWRRLRGRFSAEIQIHIPRDYNLEITSGGGNIDVPDIDGRVSLASAGGNITTGRIGGRDDSERAGTDMDRKKGDRRKPAQKFAARIETQGGQISVGNVAGTLRAATAGGHIITGDIAGDAFLRTGGGQIRSGHIAGAAELDSGGGNIHIESAGTSVSAESQGGNLVLRRADVPLRVTASDGGITAWLSEASASKISVPAEGQKPHSASQFSSGRGDISLFIPRNLAATIDATIEQRDAHRIFADPSLRVQITCGDGRDRTGTMKCAARFNGGGEVIYLKASSGNIVLRPSDSEEPSSEALSAGWTPGSFATTAMDSVNSGGGEEFTEAEGLFAEMRQKILESWWGAIPVDADEMQKHLEHSVAPVYPEVARRAGIEGDVVMRVYVSSSGRVTEIKILDGPPVLARAAVQAVQLWQYQAPRMNGRPANIVTSLVVSFRLH